MHVHHPGAFSLKDLEVGSRRSGLEGKEVLRGWSYAGVVGGYGNRCDEDRVRIMIITLRCIEHGLYGEPMLWRARGEW